MRGGLLAGAIMVAIVPAWAADVSGRATALDSDKVIIGQQRVLIWGIDGPELDQDRGGCAIQGRPYGCGTNSHRQMMIIVEEGPLTCIDTGQTDPYRRPYMTCMVNGKDVGEEMVRSGWALANKQQTDKYVATEAAAKAAKVGLWQAGVTFITPWDWREQFGR